MHKNKIGQGVYVFAYDTIANVPKTGDAANITANISKNGGANSAVSDTNPTEIGGGLYWFDLTKAETNTDALLITPSTTTAGIQINPITVYPKRQIPGTVVHEGTAQGAGTGNNQIQLEDATASIIDGAYDPSMVVIVDGTGAGQARLILQYDGASKTATVDRNWKVNPASDSEYQIVGDAGREHVNEGLVRAATTNTVTLNVLASSADDAYKNQMIFIRSGTGDDQTKRIASYDGTSKIATLSDDWDIIPDATSGYVMLPMTCVEVQAIKGQEISNKAGENFETFYNNGGRTSELIMDLLNANRVINTDTTPWQLEYKHKTTGDILLTQKMTNTEGENIRNINNVLGGLTAP